MGGRYDNSLGLVISLLLLDTEDTKCLCLYVLGTKCKQIYYVKDGNRHTHLNTLSGERNSICGIISLTNLLDLILDCRRDRIISS